MNAPGRNQFYWHLLPFYAIMTIEIDYLKGAHHEQQLEYPTD